MCPRASSNGAVPHAVRSITGSGVRYTYRCTCGCTWSQVRPANLQRGQDARLVMMTGEKRGGGYRCGVCGRLKAGHTCMKKRSLDDMEGVIAAEKAAAEKGAAAEEAAEEAEAERVGAECQALLPEASRSSSPMTELRAILHTRGAMSDGARLSFLCRHDLRPSEYETMQASIGEAVRVRVVVEGVAATTRAYLALVDETMKNAHERLLREPGERQLLVAVRGFAGSEEMCGVLLFDARKRRGNVDLVHTLPRYRHNGIAQALALAVKRQVAAGNSLTIESPWCTARAAVHVWVGAGFIGCENLIYSELRDDASYSTRGSGASVTLTFSWSADLDEKARVLWLRRAAAKHAELAKFL